MSIWTVAAAVAGGGYGPADVPGAHGDLDRLPDGLGGAVAADWPSVGDGLPGLVPQSLRRPDRAAAAWAPIAAVKGLVVRAFMARLLKGAA
jgi:hypothetical protein